MYEYKYVDIFSRQTREGLMIYRTFDEISIVIDEHSAKGYKFIGQIPKKIDSYGCIYTITLVFEKEIIS